MLSEQMLREHYEQNEIKKKSEAKVKKLTAEIKEILRGLNKDHVEEQIGDYTATYHVQDRTDGMDEAKLVAILEEMGLEEALETVKRPKEDVIQKLIYEEKLPASILQDCVISKRVAVLTVGKVKTGGKSSKN